MSKAIIKRLEEEAINYPPASHMHALCIDSAKAMTRLMKDNKTLRAGLKAHGEEAAKGKKKAGSKPARKKR